jgi:predicted deacylase
MNPAVSVAYLEVGHLASLAVRIPVVTVGSGEPVLSVTCGVHGDETMGVMAGYQFVQRLLQEPDLNGTVRLIPAANPIAQATGTRVTLADYGDLQVGRGQADGSLTKRMAHHLYSLLIQSTLVVDLHEFGDMDTPTMAVYIPVGTSEVNQRILDHIAALSPDWVWVVPNDRGSIAAALIQGGVPSLGVETGNALLLTDRDVERVSDGLYRVAQMMGIVPGKPTVSSVVAYDRTSVTSECAGLWQPDVQLSEIVENGQVVGRVVPFPLISQEVVHCAKSGRVVQLARRQLVRTGSDLLAIGQENDPVTAALRAVALRFDGGCDLEE